jgi:pilus assembly protein CpaB
MNRSRVIVLGLAAIAAGAAAFLARGFLGGGTELGKAQPAAVSTVGVLVASSNIEPGRALTPDMVRWQPWPKSTVDSTFLTQDANSNPDQIVKGTVARAPIIAGEPLTNTKIVHSDAAGYMAAMVSPGMRAVSIPITTESGAGGFILPNDRVDLILTVFASDSP